MSRRSSLRALPWLAAGGLLAGHALTGSVTGPHATGPDLHGYLETVGRLCIVSAVLGLAVLVTGRLATPGDGIPSTRALVGRLAALQVTAFVLMETGERLVARASLADLVEGLPVGALVQTAIAAALAVALRWLLRASDRVRAVLALAARPRRRPISWATGDAIACVTAALGPTVGARAPPA